MTIFLCPKADILSTIESRLEELLQISGEKYGEISEVSQTGANDVWHISSGGREYLLPAIDEVIVSVDPEKERLEIRPMKGIFDDED